MHQKRAVRNTSVKRTPYKIRVSVGLLVHDVSRKRKTVFDRAWKELNITRSQWWMLVNLSQREGMSQRQIADALGLSQPSAGETLAVLEKNGFVTRFSCESDRRQRLIYLTDKSYDLLESSKNLSKNINSKIMSGVSSDEIEIVERVLSRMRDNLDNLDNNVDVSA